MARDSTDGARRVHLAADRGPAGLPIAVGAAARQPDTGLVEQLRGRVADRLTALRQERRQTGMSELDASAQRQLATATIRGLATDLVRQQMIAGKDPVTQQEIEDLVLAVEAAIYGAGVLQPFLDDPLLEDLDMNGCDRVFATYADRGRLRLDPVFTSDEDMIRAIRTLGMGSGINARPFSLTDPVLDLGLPGGSRLTATLAASARPLLSIRRNRFPQALFLSRGSRSESLVGLGTLDEQLAAFLSAAVRAGMNIIIAGATGAGKTTLLRALIHEVDATERLVTIETALELGIEAHEGLHPNVVAVQVVLPAQDGKGGMSVRDLVQRSLRMNPDRVIVGEVLGPEAIEMLMAGSQGNTGSMSTIHADSAEDAFDRLATYAMVWGQVAPEATLRLCSKALHLAVFIRRNPHAQGRRMVVEVAEVAGYADGHVIRSMIFNAGPDGRAVRNRQTPIRAAARLAEHGYDDTAWPAPWDAPAPVTESGRAGQPSSRRAARTWGV